MYLVFTRMPGESYGRRLRSLLLYLCYVFRTINSLVFLFFSFYLCCCCFVVVVVCFCLFICLFVLFFKDEVQIQK